MPSVVLIVLTWCLLSVVRSLVIGEVFAWGLDEDERLTWEGEPWAATAAEQSWI